VKLTIDVVRQLTDDAIAAAMASNEKLFAIVVSWLKPNLQKPEK